MRPPIANRPGSSGCEWVVVVFFFSLDGFQSINGFYRVLPSFFFTAFFSTVAFHVSQPAVRVWNEWATFYCFFFRVLLGFT